MPRPKKILRYKTIIDKLSINELRELRSEIDVEVKHRKNQEKKILLKQNITKTRNKLKIGQVITYKQRASDEEVISAEVTAIFANKVQIDVNGRKRSISLAKVII